MNSENLIRFVRADGTESTGPVPDMMRAYAAAGFTGKLLPVTAPAPADDVADAPADAVAPTDETSFADPVADAERLGARVPVA